MKLKHTTPCLCGSQLTYGDCCQTFHSGEKIPTTAEALMRSRYTAYALRDGAYLQATWDVTKRPENIDFSRETIELMCYV
jgi:SEC-C motif-containing protein